MWNCYWQSVCSSTIADMLKIQMLEQIVTSDSVAEQQNQEQHEQQKQQQQEEQNGYDIWVVNVFEFLEKFGCFFFDEKCLRWAVAEHTETNEILQR